MSVSRPPTWAAASPRQSASRVTREQLGVLGRDRTDRHRDRGVAVPAGQDGAAVDRDLVAGEQHPLAGDPVHHLVVDGGADAAGEGRVAVAEERGHRAGGADRVLRDPVELEGRDPGTGCVREQGEGAAHDEAGRAHGGDLGRRT